MNWLKKMYTSLLILSVMFLMVGQNVLAQETDEGCPPEIRENLQERVSLSYAAMTMRIQRAPASAGKAI